MSSPPSVALRQLVHADAAQLALAVQESLASLSRWLPWATADYGLTHAHEWVDYTQQAFEQRTAFHFGVFDHHGAFLGKVSLDQLNTSEKRANLGYWVRQSRQRQGVALQALAGTTASMSWGSTGSSW